LALAGVIFFLLVLLIIVVLRIQLRRQKQKKIEEMKISLIKQNERIQVLEVNANFESNKDTKCEIQGVHEATL
jgi:hypothetical protein